MAKGEKIANHIDVKNVYAKDRKGEWIYIDDSISGKMGYFCPGCGLEQEAVIQTKRRKNGIMRKSFFRHCAQKDDTQKRCVYSDETYRHKLAKEIIQILMKVKVPAIYVKNPDNNKEERKVRDASFVEPYKITIEKNVYKDENGNIRFGNGEGYIRPDVIFLSITGYPILFIELVATHKVDPEKLAKVKRIGVDTIQINIPAASPKDIEHAFLVTTYTKWIFCNEKQRSKYWELPSSPNIGIQKVDGFERKLERSEKSFRCREAEVKLFIRTLENFVERRRHSERIDEIKAERARITERITVVCDSIRRKMEEEYSVIRDRIEYRIQVIRLEMERIEREREKIEREQSGVREGQRTVMEEVSRIERLYKNRDSTCVEAARKRLAEKIKYIECKEREIQELITLEGKQTVNDV